MSGTTDAIRFTTRLKASRRAFTLIEIITALTIITVLSTAVCTMLFGALNGDRFLRSTNAAQCEIELAMRRITNNIREGQAETMTVGTSTITTLTQADVVNGYPSGATVTYALQAESGECGAADAGGDGSAIWDEHAGSQCDDVHDGGGGGGYGPLSD